MNFFLDKKKAIFIRILAGLVALLLLLLVFNFFQKEIKNFFYFASAPLQKSLWRAGNNFSGFFLGNLKKENDNLKKENQNLLAKISSLDYLNRENQELRQMLGNNPEGDFKLVAASAIGLEENQDFLLINKGYEDGLLEDMPLISSQKTLFGKVFEVYKNFSKVMLISNKNSVINIKIQQEDPVKTPILGVVKGKGNLSVYLDLIPPNKEIKKGDVLITSGLEGIFPKDLLVGKITNKEENDQKPFQTAEISAFFNPKTTDVLFVIVDYKNK